MEVTLKNIAQYLIFDSHIFQNSFKKEVKFDKGPLLMYS
jgi:hypothetical protein